MAKPTKTATLSKPRKPYKDFPLALEGWTQFDLGWTQAWPAETPIETGSVIAVLAHAVGLWWLNAARILYVVNEIGPIYRFGFAHGTLPDHVETGEERFTIEWDRASDGVRYAIRAFSRPNQLLPRLGYPLTRRIQRRFFRDSAAAMLHSVRLAAETPIATGS